MSAKGRGELQSFRPTWPSVKEPVMVRLQLFVVGEICPSHVEVSGVGGSEGK